MTLTPEQSISLARQAQLAESFAADRANLAAMHAATTNGLLKSAKTRGSVQQNPHTYSIQLEQGSITNQKQSGRCWLFSAMNVMRAKLIREYKLKEFELSQSYLYFCDQLEKSNYFLETILETLSEPREGRLLSFLLAAPVNDGGQWDMICNLVEKYGVLPKEAYPESACSSATRELNGILCEKLREDACILRRRHAAGESLDALRTAKAGMMEEVYRILCIALGQPPKTFTLAWRDKDDHFTREAGLTPQAFYQKYVGLDLREYVSLINAPTADKPFGRSYTVRYLGNVKEGRPVRYLNLPIDELRRAAIAQLRDGEPVWFGCDVGKRADREDGILDPAVQDLESLLGVRFGMTRAERLDYGHSLMTHAMVFQGVDLDEDGQPTRWRVENSWGKEPGRDGYYVMSDAWFGEYLYQVVVHKKYLTGAQLAACEAEPTVLEPWDPMGSLAR